MTTEPFKVLSCVSMTLFTETVNAEGRIQGTQITLAEQQYNDPNTRAEAARQARDAHQRRFSDWQGEIRQRWEREESTTALYACPVEGCQQWGYSPGALCWDHE